MKVDVTHMFVVPFFVKNNIFAHAIFAISLSAHAILFSVASENIRGNIGHKYMYP